MSGLTAVASRGWPGQSTCPAFPWESPGPHPFLVFCPFCWEPGGRVRPAWRQQAKPQIKRGKFPGAFGGCLQPGEGSEEALECLEFSGEWLVWRLQTCPHSPSQAIHRGQACALDH